MMNNGTNDQHAITKNGKLQAGCQKSPKFPEFALSDYKVIERRKEKQKQQCHEAVT